MNILFIGDIVGAPGRRVVEELLPRAVDRYLIDLVVANGENASGGIGITPPGGRLPPESGAWTSSPAATTSGNTKRSCPTWRTPTACCARPITRRRRPRGGAGRRGDRRRGEARGRDQPGRPGLHERHRVPLSHRGPAPGEPARRRSRSSWWTCTPRPPARSRPWAGTWTAG